MFSLSLSSIRTSSSTHLSAMVCKARTAAASNLLVEPANVLKFRRCPSRASSENDSHKAFQIPGICDAHGRVCGQHVLPESVGLLLDLKKLQ